MMKPSLIVLVAALAAVPVYAEEAHDHAGHGHEQHTHHDHAQPTNPAATPSEAQLALLEAQWQTFPEIACRYEQTVVLHPDGVPPEMSQRQSFDWFLWRAPDRVETMSAGSGEVWRRDTHGQLFYYRLFPRQKRAIDYYPGDLAALQVQADWDRLLTVISRDQIGQLLHEGSAQVLERQAERYTGSLGGAQVEVLWLPDERLPALVRRVYPDRTIEMTLRELHPLADSPWARPNLADYHHDDYADIGDMENDPFLQQFIHQFHGDEHVH